MFRRKVKPPFYTYIFAIIAIIYGFVKAEKAAPMVTADLGLNTFVKLGFKAYNKYFKS